MSILGERLRKLRDWAILGALVAVVVGLGRSLYGFAGTGERFSQATQEVEKLQAEHDRLKSEMELGDEAFVTEKELRDSLNLSREGEMVVLLPEELIEKNLGETETGVADDVELENWQKWVKLFW